MGEKDLRPLPALVMSQRATGKDKPVNHFKKEETHSALPLPKGCLGC